MAPDDRPPAPLSRTESQNLTRQALIEAARTIFSRDGYHGANLTKIAGEAGYSKGAVYSNFAGKAELFLAVMDHDLDRLREHERFDPMQADSTLDVRADEIETGEQRGFALATLEFVAAALRDDELSSALVERLQVLIDAYGGLAAELRPEDEQLPVEDVALLLASLDQGLALLQISGLPVDTMLLRTGLERLADPARAATRSPLGDAAQRSAAERRTARRGASQTAHEPRHDGTHVAGDASTGDS